MSIIDHLMLYADEASAHAALDRLGFGYPAGDDGEGGTKPAGWDGSRVLPCRVIVGTTPGSYTDPDTGEVYSFETPVFMDGFHINVAVDGMRDDLVAMPECVLVTDRDKATVEGATRADFVLHATVSPETMDAVKGVTPVFAGSGYPFGTG